MKLLIIEDSIRLTKALKTGFTRTGYAVDVVHDGKLGLSHILGYDYDVVILDIMLPGMDGIEILRKLREKSRETRVIILSARDQVEDKVLGLNLGADDYLAKPFDFDELAARVAALVRKRYGKDSNELKIGNTCINLNTNNVLINEEELDLTASEFLILKYLMVNQGRVLSLEQIIEHISITNKFIAPTTIEVHLSNLRKKLKTAQATLIITNKRGFGYFVESGS